MVGLVGLSDILLSHFKKKMCISSIKEGVSNSEKLTFLLFARKTMQEMLLLF